MKRILVCDKGDLREWYGHAAPDGGPLRLRRLEQAGRLELVQIVNDPPPYWFVLIRNFDGSPIGKDRQTACDRFFRSRGIQPRSRTGWNVPNG
jgi:hypothetical protein